MDDLISRAAALEAISHCCAIGESEKETRDCCYVAVSGFVPSVDAVVVVKCKDCKFGKLCLDADGHDLIHCTNTDYPAANIETWSLELDWYCAGGERRDSE